MAVITSPRTARRYLRDLQDPSTQFRTTDGKSLKNLIELACYLKACGDEAFKYHVSKEHNHFSNWVAHNVLDKDLANQMSLVLQKNPMRLIISKRVNHLVHNATRAASGRERAKMILEDAQLPEEVFLSNDGRTIRNLWELKEFVDGASENVIAYHLSPDRNDFSEWIGGVLMDVELADNLDGLRERSELSSQIANRLSHLEAFSAHSPKGHNLSEYVELIKSCPKNL